jgi:RimJ/RimL family protein N-acetyltransferase
MNFEIKQAGYFDKDLMKQLMVEGLIKDPSAFTVAEKEYSLQSEIWWNNYLSSYMLGIDSKLFFGYEDNNLIGMIGVVFPGRERQKHTAWIYWVWLKSEFRGKGYGKKMIQHSVDVAFERTNVIKINLQVVSSQEKAIMLYKKIGFVESGSQKKEIFLDNEYLDFISMEKFRDNTF